MGEAMRIEISPALGEDVRHVAHHLRDADFIELALSRADATPFETVLESAAGSDWCEALRVDGRAIVLYGLYPSQMRGSGVPWMVATQDIHRIERDFVRRCRPVVGRMLDAYPYLYNQVHCDNETSIRWLRWLGFSIDDAPSGPGGAFFYFWRGEHV